MFTDYEDYEYDPETYNKCTYAWAKWMMAKNKNPHSKETKIAFENLCTLLNDSGDTDSVKAE